MDKNHIIVVGAGVIGLSTGIKLLESGYSVTMVADKFSPHTTSNAAPACFHPYINPSNLLSECIAASWKEYHVLQKKIPDIIKDIMFTELFPEKSSETEANSVPRKFLQNLPHYRELSERELPDGYRQGTSYQTIMIDISLYISYLNEQFLKLGGIQEKKTVHRLEEWVGKTELLINCSGCGAKELVNDSRLTAVRGQAHSVVKLDNIKNATLALIKDSKGYPDHPDYAIIVPRSTDIYIAGTTQFDDWDLDPRKQDEEMIFRRCVGIVPELKHSKIQKTYVGLRPERLSEDGLTRSPRLSHEIVNEQLHVIHNYGHAGAGITASWGAAEKVLTMIRQM